MKKLVIGTLAAALVFGGSIGIGTINQGFAQDDNSRVKTVQSKKTIGTIKAKAVALKRVKGGKVESVELEKEHGRKVYDVDIDRKNKEYEVHVDAYTAKVLKVEIKDDDDRDDKKAKSVKKSITKNQAIAIAKKKINGTVIEAKKDEDDGRIVYEIELRTKKGKAEIKIDVRTGKVLDVEFDHDKYDDDHDDD